MHTNIFKLDLKLQLPLFVLSTPHRTGFVHYEALIIPKIVSKNEVDICTRKQGYTVMPEIIHTVPLTNSDFKLLLLNKQVFLVVVIFVFDQKWHKLLPKDNQITYKKQKPQKVFEQKIMSSLTDSNPEMLKYLLNIKAKNGQSQPEAKWWIPIFTLTVFLPHPTKPTS